MFPVVVTNEGLKVIAGLVRPSMAGVFQVGLFRNDVEPGHGSRLVFLGPANFSGYDGPRFINSWSAPEFDGTYATLTGPNVVWTHNGGPIWGRVYGYYIATPAGLIVWAQRLDPPTWLTSAGQTYRVQPRFQLRSEF